MPNPLFTPNDTIVRKNIPVFAPSKVVAITATVEWSPSTADVAFCASSDTTFKIGTGTLYYSLSAGQVIGIKPGNKFTFSTSFNLAVM
jgi:hypothetical protein